MKKFQFLFFILCIGIIVFTSGCKPKVVPVNNDLVMDSVAINKSYFINNDTLNPGCKLNIQFTYPKNWSLGLDLAKLQSLFIEKTFHERFSKLTPIEAVADFEKQYISDFETDMTNNPLSEEEEYELKDESGYTYYITIRNEIVYNKNNFLSFTVHKEIYEGGAHGSKSINGYVVNLKTGELLHEEDFAGNSYSQNMSELFCRKLMEKNEISKPQELENIGYNPPAEIVPNNNFVLDENGITYFFNEYEIAAYFIGVTTIFIPYKELNLYLLKNSPISEITGH